jgi:hypothetical protein
VKRLPVALAAFAFALILAATALAVATGTHIKLESQVFVLALTVVFAVTGVLIAGRQPRNPIGWLFLAAAIAAGMGSLSASYARSFVDGGTGSPAVGRTAAVYANLGWIPFIVLPTTFLLLLFPDGRLLSRRWRPVAWLAGFGIAASFVTGALQRGRLEDYPRLQNPYGVDSPAIDALKGLSLLALTVAILASAVSLIVRFRRARGEQRLQMKWLAFAGAIAALTFPLALASYDTVGATVANGAVMLSVLGLPIATCVAILRYRLYDIDVVINWTLVYGALTATLAVAYLGSVLLLQLALSGVTGGSGLAVAASTLAVAALFRPARARIQDGVDRRFYRRKYNAQRTLASFAASVRDEVDLEALGEQLGGVVRETFQPEHVSLWLRSREARP